MDSLEEYNAVLGFISNIVVGLTYLAGLLFVILYSALFNPSRTTAGRLVRQTVISLLGLALPPVLHIWFTGDEWWWPTLRLIIYVFVAYSFGSLVWLVIVRRFFPRWVKTAPNSDDWLEGSRRRSRD